MLTILKQNGNRKSYPCAQNETVKMQFYLFLKYLETIIAFKIIRIKVKCHSKPDNERN